MSQNTKTTSGWMKIGAQYARVTLSKYNQKNRPRRETHVKALHQAMMRGEWRKTHQGIAFDEDGNLIDGQHRLMALAQMPDDFFIEMLVTTDLPRGEAWDAIDVNGCKRTVSDVLGCDRKVAAIAAIFDITMTGTKALSPTVLEPFVKFFHEETSALFHHCGTIRKAWSSASVQAAAVFVMKVKPWSRQYVLNQYAALVLSSYRDMSDIVQSLHRSVESGSRRQTSRMDLFARCIKAFDVDNQNLSRVLIRSTGNVLDEVRAQMVQLMPQLRQRAS
jgi:hypothetical protein